jgi:hypothetical protein
MKYRVVHLFGSIDHNLRIGEDRLLRFEPTSDQFDFFAYVRPPIQGGGRGHQ